jgi:hypothetical protein
MVVQQASQPITNDSPFADLAANHDSASTNSHLAVAFHWATFPTQKPRHRRGLTQGHQRSMEALTPAMQMIETAVTAQSH